MAYVDICDFASDDSPCGTPGSDDAVIVDLLSCTRDVHDHLILHGISSSRDYGISSNITEYNLILNRAGMFNVAQEQIKKLKVCQKHRYWLSSRWPGVRKLSCTFPDHQGKKTSMTNPRRVTEAMSKALFNRSKQVVPIGSALCRKCRDTVYHITGTSDGQTREDMPDETSREARETDQDGKDDTYQLCSSLYVIDSGEASDSNGEELPAEKSVWEDTMSQQKKNREALNQAIGEISEGRTSPVSSTLNTQWEGISQRQQNYYIKKAKDSIAAVFTALAPGQETELWQAVQKSSPLFDEPCVRKKQWDHPTVQSLVDAYNSAATSQTRKQILSVFADDFTIPELQNMISGLSEWRIKQARAHAAEVGSGQPVENKPIHRTRLNPVQTDHFLEFISRPEFLQDVAYGTKKMCLDTGETLTIPAAIRTLIPTRIIQQYMSYCASIDFPPLSERTLHRVLSACAASKQKSLEGLDYITSNGAKAFDTLHQVVDILAENGLHLQLADEMKTRLKTGKRYLKTDFRVHVQTTSGCPDHCICYALNDTSEDNFSSRCNHDHDLICDRCDQIRQVLHTLEDMISNPNFNMSEPQRVRLMYDWKQATDDIADWKAHILRTVNQEHAKQTALNNLDTTSILVVMDWAMKYLPRRYRETMSDFFGKKGKSWHVTAVVHADQGEYSVECVVHIFESCIQNWYAVASILEHVLKVIKSENPNVTTAYLKSDNAGCYHNGSLLQSLPGISERCGIEIARYDFSDPQSGKDVCDRKIAPMKAQIRRYVDEKHDVLSASDMKEAIESHGGVSGVRVAVAELDTTTKESRETKCDGISSLNNFHFESEGIRAWKAYDIGQGQLYPHKVKVNDDNLDTELTIIGDMGTRQCGYFRPPQQTPHVSNELFTCTEEGCILSFGSETKLQHHLDIGQHILQLECESTYDTIKKKWSQTVTGLTQAAFERQGTSEEHLRRADSVTSTASAKEGWALKKSKKHSKMSSRVKEFLTDTFNKGVETGMKATPSVVAHQMRHKTYVNGELFFQPSEWRTEKQVNTFFARMSAIQRRRNVNEEEQATEVDIDEDDINAVIVEEAWQTKRLAVYDSVDYEHPLTYQSNNLCQLSKQNKLATLKLQILREICTAFNLNTSGSRNRKKTFVEPIAELVNTCRCSI